MRAKKKSSTTNKTGLPDKLKAGLEQLSGLSMDDVKVHFNSGKPAQLQAQAYAQGTQIYVTQGQETHLPHEAWHVVKQTQGRVKPTRQLKGLAVNDDLSLEKEADRLGAKAISVLQVQLTVFGDAAFTQPLNKGPYSVFVILGSVVKDINTLSFKLMLNGDVKEQIDMLKEVVYKSNGEIHRPNYVKLQWATDEHFAGMLTSMDVDYAEFTPEGAPLSAKVSLSFKGV